jgi:hypothetical protein
LGFRKLHVGLVATAAVGMVAMSASAVSASPASPGETSQIIKVRTPDRSVIVCDLVEALRIGHPHKSHHEPRNVNVVATVTCSQAVPNISLTVRLYRNGKKANSQTHRVFGKKFIKGNASAGCKGTAGNYQGMADTRVVFPPRYVPPVESGHVKSKVVKVNCWK